MRVIRPRFRLRTLLLLIVALAVSLWGERTRRQQATYRAMAAEQAALEEGSRETCRVCRENVVGLAGRGLRALYLGELGGVKGWFTNAAAFVPEASRLERLTAYHSQLRRKYEDAARRPWLPVEPDPPSP
jgi:hypothetical protein